MSSHANALALPVSLSLATTTVVLLNVSSRKVKKFWSAMADVTLTSLAMTVAFLPMMFFGESQTASEAATKVGLTVAIVPSMAFVTAAPLCAIGIACNEE